MESRRKAAVLPPERTRTRNLVIRLNDREREMLDEIADALHLSSASEGFRFVLRESHERHVPKRGAGRGTR